LDDNCIEDRLRCLESNLFDFSIFLSHDKFAGNEINDGGLINIPNCKYKLPFEASDLPSTGAARTGF